MCSLARAAVTQGHGLEASHSTHGLPRHSEVGDGGAARLDGLALDAAAFLCPHRVVPLFLCPDSLFRKDAGYIGSGATQGTSFLTNHLCQGPVLTYGPIQRRWGFGLASEFGGDTSQPATQSKRRGGPESPAQRGGQESCWLGGGGSRSNTPRAWPGYRAG